MALVKDTVKSSPQSAEPVFDERPIWEIIVESGPEIPQEEREACPHDGGQNYKHYLYSYPDKVSQA